MCPDSAAVLRRRIAEVDASAARLREVCAALAGQLAQTVAARCEFT